MIIAKFGGKSVAKAKNIKTICGVAGKLQNKKLVIVVSAVSQVTNMLFELTRATGNNFDEILEMIRRAHFELVQSYFGVVPTEIEKYINKRLGKVRVLAAKPNMSKADIDNLVINGEMMSSYIIAHALSASGIEARQVIATELIVTDDNFGSAEFLADETTKKTKDVIQPLVENGIVPVVTGFVGATKKGTPTTLGRGGSDYTATIMGFALGAKEIQIWTDVDGVFSADPHLIPNARLLKKISFMEASELSFFGAKILHPRTMRPARRKGIPMRILNTMNPTSEGTIIDTTSGIKKAVKALTYKKHTKLINLYSTDMLFSKGFLAQIFSVFAMHDISVDLVGVSEVSVSVTLDNHESLNAAILKLSEFTQVTNVSGFGIVSLVGEDIVQIPHIMKKIFSVLEEEDINVKMISLSATDVNISLVIESKNIEKAVKSLHERIIL